MSVLPQELSVTISGVTYKLSKFTLPLYQEYVDWIRKQLPDPWEGLAERCKGLSVELQKYLIDKAEQKASSRTTLNDPEVSAFANSLSGVKRMLGMLFRKYHPAMTEVEVCNVIEAGIAEHGADFFSQCFSDLKDSSNPTPQL